MGHDMQQWLTQKQTVISRLCRFESWTAASQVSTLLLQSFLVLRSSFKHVLSGI